MTEPTSFSIMPGGPCDLDRVAALYSAAMDSLRFLPFRATPAEDRGLIGRIAAEAEFLLAVDKGPPVAALALRAPEIPLLCTHPEHAGRGAGRALLAAAKRRAPMLELGCFALNRRACLFYERQGFAAISMSDGSENRERLPVIRYRWGRGETEA